MTHFVARGWIIRDALVDVFDAVLLERGCEGLVKEGRVVRSNVNSLMGRLGKMVKKPFGSGSGSGGAGGVVGGMIRSMVLLPLNFVPVVGTLLYVYVKGKKAGPGLHARYFQLRGFGGRDREEWVQKRRGGYTGYVSFSLSPFPWLCLAWVVRLTGTDLEWRLCYWRWCPLRRCYSSLVTPLGLRCGRRI